MTQLELLRARGSVPTVPNKESCVVGQLGAEGAVMRIGMSLKFPVQVTRTQPLPPTTSGVAGHTRWVLIRAELPKDT